MEPKKEIDRVKRLLYNYKDKNRCKKCHKIITNKAKMCSRCWNPQSGVRANQKKRLDYLEKEVRLINDRLKILENGTKKSK